MKKLLKKLFLGADKVLSALYIASFSSDMPLYADMFAVCL